MRIRALHRLFVVAPLAVVATLATPDDRVAASPDEPDPSNSYTKAEKAVDAPPPPVVGRPEWRGPQEGRRVIGCNGREYELDFPPPYYPKACANGAEGRVVVEFDITAAGDVTNAHIIETTEACFNESVVGTVSRRKYPPMCNEAGEPYSRRGVRETFVFELAD